LPSVLTVMVLSTKRNGLPLSEAEFRVGYPVLTTLAADISILFYVSLKSVDGGDYWGTDLATRLGVDIANPDNPVITIYMG